jgi:hypothetical protein
LRRRVAELPQRFRGLLTGVFGLSAFWYELLRELDTGPTAPGWDEDQRWTLPRTAEVIFRHAE